MNPALLDGLRSGFGENLLRYYELARKNDLYISFAVTPPSGIRSREILAGEARDDPTLQVVGEDDSGVIVSGMKMLASGAVFADGFGSAPPSTRNARARASPRRCRSTRQGSRSGHASPTQHSC